MIKSRLRTSNIQEEYNRSAHEEAPIEVWEKVIQNYPEMKEWVAINKTVPVEILEQLSNDVDVKVRFTVAMKRKLPESLQLKLVNDDESSVRERLVYNAKATKKVLEVLSNDCENRIKERAVERLSKGEYK